MPYNGQLVVIYLVTAITSRV